MLITVIIPVYNAEKYLDDCILSLQNQTYKNLQLVFVNDGSTDGSLQIMRKYALTDNRIEIVDKQNGGVSSARNAGLNVARGEYIGWVDADDYVESDMFEFLINMALKFEADISECSFASVYNNETLMANFGGNTLCFGYNNFMLERYLSSDIFYGLVTKLFKKSIFENVRFPEGRIWEDIWLVTKVCLGQYKYARNPVVKYYYRQTEGSIIRSDISERKARESIYILEKTLHLIESCQFNSSYKKKLYELNMTKAVFWYLDLALSANKKLKNVYSQIYIKRMQFANVRIFFNKSIPVKNKVSFVICILGLKNQLYYIKTKLFKLK